MPLIKRDSLSEKGTNLYNANHPSTEVTDSTASKSNVRVEGTPTLFRVSIQVKPAGAIYRVFKDGDFLFCRGDCEPLDLFIGNNDWTDLNSSDIIDDSPIANDISLFSDLLWQIFIKV